jgi:hypothetical protein
MRRQGTEMEQQPGRRGTKQSQSLAKSDKFMTQKKIKGSSTSNADAMFDYGAYTNSITRSNGYNSARTATTNNNTSYNSTTNARLVH